ncbi:MAG: ADP-glyceromanno-heptose 6-epimerase [bacterium]|nr:ADP-glyceromanno-heptose 6-epimerase [bacterium]
MIVITGAEGFIGSCLVARLNADHFNDLILVDDFGDVTGREKNLFGKTYTACIPRTDFFTWMDANAHEVQFVFHIGARTDTSEKDETIFKLLNLDFSIELFKRCTAEGIPMVWASSAATYGAGENGYNDDESKLDLLQPMNTYGRSKNDFDKWVLTQDYKPSFWAGLKFFNVYGPNEYHKNRMASVMFHAYNQVKENKQIKLFKSHKAEFADGAQMRDFIYVKDLCDVCVYLMHHRKNSGIYNLGTGKARTWNHLAKSIFDALNLPENIQYIPIPEDIRDSYQYFTEANMNKLISAGYNKEFTSLEDGVKEYVSEYLEKEKWY